MMRATGLRDSPEDTNIQENGSERGVYKENDSVVLPKQKTCVQRGRIRNNKFCK